MILCHYKSFLQKVEAQNPDYPLLNSEEDESSADFMRDSSFKTSVAIA